MGIKLYDDAVLEKIKKWFPAESKLKILKPNESKRLFELKADENSDKTLTLPLISIARDPSIGLDIPGRRNLSCDGIKLDASEATTLQLNAIPINVTYQFDIYTKRYEEGDDILRGLVFNMLNHPKMIITIPYNDVQIQHICYLAMEPEITDNSDIAEKLFADEFTRWTIRAKVNDAYLFSVPATTNTHLIGVELEVKDKQPGDDIITVEYDSENKI